jgi:hypothetical protein
MDTGPSSWHPSWVAIRTRGGWQPYFRPTLRRTSWVTPRRSTQNRRDVPARFSTSLAGHDRRDVSLPTSSTIPTLDDRIEVALRQRGNPGRTCPPKRRPDVGGPASAVLKRAGASLQLQGSRSGEEARFASGDPASATSWLTHTTFRMRARLPQETSSSPRSFRGVDVGKEEA